VWKVVGGEYHKIRTEVTGKMETQDRRARKKKRWRGNRAGRWAVSIRKRTREKKVPVVLN